MSNHNRVEMIVFDEGEGIKIDFKFDNEFNYDDPSPVEEVAMALFMYVSEQLQGEVIKVEDT